MNAGNPVARWRKTLSRSAAILVAAAGLGLAHVTPASALVLDVSLDTTVLNGVSAQLAFDLTDFGGNPDNRVGISNFSTDGMLGGTANSGDVSGGPLPADATVGDATFFNEWLQDIVLGNSVSFRLTISEEIFGASPDQFAFFLLDPSTGFPYPTMDPTGADALLVVDITGPRTLAPVAHGPAVGAPQVTLTFTTVDAPGSALLALMGVTLLLAGAGRGRATARS